MLDLDAYLARIGLEGRPELAAVHRAQVCSIPFENLDPHRGVPVSLETGALEGKLVTAMRGGYCFELNLLLAAALEGLGARVEPMLARVRWNAPPEFVRPLTHLLLRVETGGEIWHADVGFGVGTLLAPIPFGPGGPYEQSSWRFQVVEEGDELVLQTETEDGWRDVYAFAPRPVPPIDIELSNWFTSTHPGSGFVSGLVVASNGRDGTRTVLTDWGGDLSLIVQTPSSTSRTPVERGTIPAVLEQQFGLPGFEVDGAGRVYAAA